MIVRFTQPGEGKPITHRKQNPDREAHLAQLAARMRRIVNDDGTITPTEAGVDLMVEESAEGIHHDCFETLDPVAVLLKP